MTGAQGRGALGGIGSGDEGGSPWMADPEEHSGVQVCNDPLRGICCKARCRTAVQSQKVNQLKHRSQIFRLLLQLRVLSYLCAGVLRVAVQIGEHTGEGVDIGVDFGVIARRLFRTAMLQTEQQKN